jgi:hypothetical protein
MPDFVTMTSDPPRGLAKHLVVVVVLILLGLVPLGWILYRLLP